MQISELEKFSNQYDEEKGEPNMDNVYNKCRRKSGKRELSYNYPSLKLEFLFIASQAH